MQLNQPGGPIKLTNVSIVKYKKGGKRLEIACYKNKVLEWRSGIEKDLDQVLQTRHVFTNVSKGQVASHEDLKQAFKTDNIDEIILHILKKGDIQIGEKERQLLLQNTSRDIVQILAHKCINPVDKTPYSTGIIKRALEQVGFSVSLSKPTKLQAWEALKQLQSSKTLEIARARIKVCIQWNDSSKLKTLLKELIDQVLSENYQNNSYEMLCLIEPGALRKVNDLMQKETRGNGRLEVLEMSESLDQLE